MLDQSQITHHLAPKARIKQVQNRVRDSADVLVDGKPIRDFGRVIRCLVVVRITVAVEIPRRIHERVHRVRFTARGSAASWALRVYKFGRPSKRGFAFAGELRIRRQQHRQILIRHGNHSVFGAINDGNRCAPIALTRDSPVAQPVDGFRLAKSLLFRDRSHFRDGVFRREPVERPGVHQLTLHVLVERSRQLFCRELFAFDGLHNHADW